jgi:hypothetical protein
LTIVKVDGGVRRLIRPQHTFLTLRLTNYLYLSLSCFLSFRQILADEEAFMACCSARDFLFFHQTLVFQQGRTPTPGVLHPKELNSPALKNVSEANNGSIPPTRTPHHKQATMGEEEFASLLASEKLQVTHVLLKVGVA